MSNIPFTFITKPQKLARVKNAVKAIYTDADNEDLLILGHGKVNTFYECWHGVCEYPECKYAFLFLLHCHC